MSCRLATGSPDSWFIRAAWAVLADMTAFSRLVIQLPLRRYQIEPLRAILTSILARQGLEFLLIFPRQSGKNEALAQLLVYLLNIYRRSGSTIIYGAHAIGRDLGLARLDERLDNVWNQGAWVSRLDPPRRSLGRAHVLFLSTHPAARTRGQTAHHLLVIDEAQDQNGPHIEAVFTPMRAATNATAVYLGTVKLASDFLWQKKLQLEAEEQADGTQRVFVVRPETVMAENPLYRDFLNAQVRRHGRRHPIVASEYFLEPIDGTGGLFPERRRALMLGDHCRERAPQAGACYVATLDVAGEDEASTDPMARLQNPARDYTVATVFRVEHPQAGSRTPGPTYRAVDVFVDHGSKHFQDAPGRPALVERLYAWLEHWGVAHLVCDESGVGLGITSWLAQALGQSRVTGYNFAGAGKKAALGCAFLSLIETGRFRYWPIDRHLGDAFWFWAQVAACTYHVPPDGRFDRDLRWGVAPAHTTDTAAGPEPTHDDRLLSAALIAHLDSELAAGRLLLGTAQSAVLPPSDPIAGLAF